MGKENVSQPGSTLGPSRFRGCGRCLVAMDLWVLTCSWLVGDKQKKKCGEQVRDQGF